MKLTVAPALKSLSRVKSPERKPLRVALVQTKWHQNDKEHEQVLLEGIKKASENGAKIVFLQELTLSRYPADSKPEGLHPKLRKN